MQELKVGSVIIYSGCRWYVVDVNPDGLVMIENDYDTKVIVASQIRRVVSL